MTSFIWKGTIYNNVHQQRDSLPPELVDLLIEKGVMIATDQSDQPGPPLPPATLLLPPRPSEDLTVLSKLGDGRAKQLNALGYNAIADIAEALPELLAAIDGVSPAMAELWIDEANQILSDDIEDDS